MQSKTLLILLTLLTITSIWLTLLVTKHMSTTHINKITNPDAFMHNVYYTEYDKNGTISTQIQTPKIIHYQNQDLYRFTKPKLKTITTNKQTWMITANHAESFYGSHKIRLWDHVKIVEPANPYTDIFTLKTSAITIYPTQKTATTDQPIIMTQGTNITKAIGAKADFQKGLIKLLSQIEATFNFDN